MKPTRCQVIGSGGDRGGIGNARDTRDAGSVLGLGRFPGEENGNPLQYCCLENSVDRGAWWATVHVLQSWTRLSKHGIAWSVETDGHALLQGILPTQGLNPRLLCLLLWQADSLPRAPPGSPLFFPIPGQCPTQMCPALFNFLDSLIPGQFNCFVFLLMKHIPSIGKLRLWRI